MGRMATNIIQLTDGFEAVILPPDLAWPDEFEWTPVAQEASYALNGALIVETGIKRTGRPITLQSGDDRAWITGDKLQVLQGWAAQAGATFGLLIRGQIRRVLFRHHDGPAVEAEPILFHGDEPGTGEFRCTLKFVEVEQQQQPSPDPDPQP